MRIIDTRRWDKLVSIVENGRWNLARKSLKFQKNKILVWEENDWGAQNTAKQRAIG